MRLFQEKYDHIVLSLVMINIENTKFILISCNSVDLP